uniref:Uncharacterized protein n=1 Tax=Tetranychus urticae TaxID=32264 RepID=T1L4K3_TETUR
MRLTAFGPASLPSGPLYGKPYAVHVLVSSSTSLSSPPRIPHPSPTSAVLMSLVAGTLSISVSDESASVPLNVEVPDSTIDPTGFGFLLGLHGLIMKYGPQPRITKTIGGVASTNELSSSTSNDSIPSEVRFDALIAADSSHIDSP